MDFSVWMAFATASIVILISPGPTIFYVMSLALKNGMQNAVYASLGVALGDLIAISLAMTGLGILLSSSLILFSILKMICGGYRINLTFKF